MGFFDFGKKKKKPGYVYIGESTRSDGSKKIYTGMTTRSPRTRWGEHMDAVKSGKRKTWIGKGTNFRPIGAVRSSNPRKAERTIKQMSPEQKRAFGRSAARRYKKRNYW